MKKGTRKTRALPVLTVRDGEVEQKLNSLLRQDQPVGEFRLKVLHEDGREPTLLFVYPREHVILHVAATSR